MNTLFAKIQYNSFLVYCRELSPGTVCLTGDRAQGDDSKHDSHYTIHIILYNNKVIIVYFYIYIGLDKQNFSIKLLIFSYPLVLTYVLGDQKNRLIETVLLSTHNICFG